MPLFCIERFRPVELPLCELNDPFVFCCWFKKPGFCLRTEDLAAEELGGKPDVEDVRLCASMPRVSL